MKKLNIEKQTIIHLLLYNFLFISICFTQNTERHPKSNHNYNSFNRDQEFVYHTIGNMWFSWDNYGNAGDQSCSALYPSFDYPGGGNLTYQCRGGYWVLSHFAENDDYLEGTTGVYELSIGTEPISHTAGWANPDNAYSKEPWVSEIIYETEGGVRVIMKHYSWSFPGTTNYFFRVGDPLEEFDFDDFVLEEIYLVYNGSSMTSPPDTLDELVIGMKSDFDIAWNVPNPDWDYAFWTDDQVDWDNETQTTFGYDGDDPGSPSNDFGIDDPGREYRGVKIGQTWIESPDAFIDGQIIPAEDAITHMWWTGDQDPETAIERFEIATRVHSAVGDSKGNVPEPMDARYLQAYGPWKLGLGDTVKIITAKVQASGVWSMQNAAKAASKAYAWNLNLPKPPPAPQMDAGMNAVLSDRSIKIWWKNPNEGAIDPDLGLSDFAGYRIYRSVSDSSWDAASIYEVEELTPDEGSDIDEGTTLAGNQVGPFVLVKEITVAELNDYLIPGTTDEYEWVDTTTVDFKKHWHYVASFDTGGETDVFSGITYVPSLESGRTLVYPMEDEENGITSTIPYLFAGSFINVSSENIVHGDTGMVDVYIATNEFEFSSIDISFSGFQGILNFIEIVADNSSLLGSHGWTIQVNNTDNLLITASAGAQNISGAGTLFSLKFAVPDTLSSQFVPVNVVDFTGNEEYTTTDFEITSGGVQVVWGPTVGYTSTPTTGAYPLEVIFTDTSGPGTFPINEWTWDFGDDSTGSGSVISHTYNYPGVYDVTLWIEDEFSLMDSITSVGLVQIDTLYGDVSWNAQVQSYDASLILKDLAEMIELDELQFTVGDVSGDNSLSALDATLILQYVIGLINELPYDPSTQFLASGDLSMDDQEAAPGTAVAIPVNIANGTNIYGFEAVIEFDPAVLEFDTLLLSESMASYLVYDNPLEEGIIKVAASGSSVDGNDGVFSTLHFNVNSEFTDETVIQINDLRWNEGEVVEYAAEMTLTFALGIEDDLIPNKYALHQNYPNPFNPVTTLRYDLPEDAQANVTIYNMKGQVVQTLINQKQTAGFKSVKWNATNDNGAPVSAGLYLYTIQAGEYRQTKKMVLLK